MKRETKLFSLHNILVMCKIYFILFLCITQISNAQINRKVTQSSVAIQVPPTNMLTVTSPKSTIRSVVEIKKVTYSSDLIVKTDGTTIDAKILEVTSTEIIFKKFNNLEGPTFRLNRSEIKSIRYANGEVDNNIQIPSSSNINQPNDNILSQTPQYTKTLFRGFNRKRFGILGGVNFYKLSASSSTNYSKTSSGTGFSIGFVGDFPIQKTLSLRISPMLSFKNTIASDGTTISATLIDETIDVLYHIPSTQGDFIIGGGLALSYFLSADNNGKTFSIGNNPKTDGVLPLDYGINIRGGYDSHTWSISIFYTFGLANLNPAYGNGSSVSLSTNTTGLVFTYWFGNKI
jgi:hypothetical protein